MEVRIELISIIIPMYNVLPYIKRCIESILMQTYNNFEVIIVDDGSTDGSDIVCINFAKADKRIRYIRIENSGVSVARNVGVDNAKGSFLMFVDSDDYIDRNLLKVIYAIQVKYNCDLVKFNSTITSIYKDEMDHYTENVTIYNSEEALHEYFYGNEVKLKVQVWSGLYKKELFNHINFPKRKNYEDSYITPIVLGRSTKTVYIDYPGYFYFMRSNSIMHSALNEEKIAAYDLYRFLYFNINTDDIELKNLLVQKWVYQFIYVYRLLKKEGKHLNQQKYWLKRIYGELRSDCKKLLGMSLSITCRFQLILFLVSPNLFNFLINCFELRGKKDEK